MEIIIIALLAVIIFLGIIILIKLSSKKSVGEVKMSERDKGEIINSFSQNIDYISQSMGKSSEMNGRIMSERLNNMNDKIRENNNLTLERLNNMEKAQSERLENMNKKIKENSENVSSRLEQVEKSQNDKLEYIRQTLERNITSLKTGNEEKLDEIKKTVDEKLTSTLNERFKESFKFLTDELEKVTTTMGEMKKISSEVGTLSKMLSGVKTAGIFGEIQLGAIIEEILSPEQYLKNVVTNKQSRDPVEFAIKLPGGADGEVLMPIDSKFPYTLYSDMQNLYENNDFQGFEEKKKQLLHTIRGMAKDIKEKYICPPDTTNFAVMFLPVEGLYAEVVKMGLVEELQNKYSVTVAGPTTMAALLNSLQMGFQTLAIQKKSNEVWNILSAVKTEFSKFNEILLNIQKRLNTANSDLDTLIGTRTRAISRTLKNVSEITGENTESLLGIED